MYKKISICLIFSFFLFFFSIMSFFFMIYLIMNNIIIMMEWEIISFNSSMFVMLILIDWMSLLFMSFVLLISSVVILYSKSYMSSEVNIDRFINLVLLFVVSMILMIITPNMVSILLGWDGLGLISYCLVIYYQNISSFNAGMLTVLSNRIGDVCILMIITWMLNYGSWNYLFYLYFMKNDYMMIIVKILVVIAAMTKSAQIPFSSWLPAAMAAPTPVSALVHSSTLVTAGVYLLIRFNFLLVDTIFFKLLLLLSGLTMLMAGISANFEFDLKKIIALSTLSQLGLMMSILSMGYYDLAFFHLLTHAMFKALLFMCAGVIIHMMMNKQDIRFMGGLSNFIPMTSLCLNISNLSLCGIPFLAGFYSKDLILEMVCLSNLNFLIFLLYYISTGLTMFYTIRMLFYLMLNNFNLVSIFNLYDDDFIMLKSMFVLLFMTLIMGSLLNWLIFCIPYIIYIPMYLKLMVIMVSGIGGMLGYFISKMSIISLSKFNFFYKLSSFNSMMWFMLSLSTWALNIHFLNLGKYFLNQVDMGWSELMVMENMYLIIKKNSIFNQIYQNNNFKIFMFGFFIWLVIYMINFMVYYN